ncbi:family 16 glycosylhydrolase, partial [Aequoribacter sp.]|uniref:family 16 glycosylhydrolase n=1 Tax=Aequoribacter sp. TaxID=2847771 RepID=UPI003C390C21
MSATLKYPSRLVGAIALATLVSACGGGNSDGAQGGSLANPEPPTTGDWQLVWEDSFDGDSLDTSSWEVQTGNGAAEGIPGWGNNELQFYQADNIAVADGMLKIEARQDNSNPGFDYTSGRLRTQGKVDFTFGRVEARIKVPSGQGLWSAFWLLGTDPSVYGGWAAKGEIDILEKYKPGFFSSALHYGGAFPQNETVTGVYENEVADEFHVYAVEWDDEFIRFFVDGENFYTVTSDTYYNYYYRNRAEGFGLGGKSAPFDEDHHIILNLAVGGNLPGNPDPAVLPASMEVDYVRVYECPVDATTGKGCRDSIDAVNDYITFDVADDAPIVSSETLYKNGTAAVFPGTDVQRDLSLEVYDNGGVFSATEVVDSDGETVIEVITSGGGNVSLADATGATFNLVNMGSVDFPLSTADFKFDIKLDPESTDETGELQVKFDSGFPDVALAFVPMSQLGEGEWTKVSVPVADILAGGLGVFGGGPANVSALVNLITFEPTKAARFMLNNIRLECGAKEFCGIQAVATKALPVFDGAASSNFDRGIVGYDTVSDANYTTSSGNHVSWQVVDSGDADRGTVIETTFSGSGASGVTYVGSTQSVDLTPWAAGEIAFDVKVVSNPNNFPMVFKLDGLDQGSNSTGDLSLGVLPVGEWQTIRVPLAQLSASGFDISDFAAFVLFPTFAGQDVVFQWGNIRVEPTISVVPRIVAVPVDFEGPAISYRFSSFEGGAASVVANPEPAVLNASDNAVEFKKFPGATFGGTVLNLDEPVDFSQGEVFKLAVWSARPASLTFKLEGLNIERVLPLTGEGWELVEADFSGSTAGPAVEGLTFIFDNGTVGAADSAPADWTFYVDNVELIDAPSVPGQIARVGFEDANPALGVVGGGWKVFANVFNAGGDYLYGYGPFDAPNNTGGFSGVASAEDGAAQGSYALSVFSDYNNGDAHTAGDRIESSTFLEYVLTEADVGTMVFSFDVKKPAQNGLEAPSQAIAYVQLLDPNNGYAVTARQELDVSESSVADWTAETIELIVDANKAGQILQYGFTSVASNNAPSAMLYDNILLVLQSGTDPQDPEEPQGASFEFSDDFEAFDVTLAEITGWVHYVNAFAPNGDYLGGGGGTAAPNGGNISNVTSGEAGIDQGIQYLNVFSNYGDNGNHEAGNILETSVYREFIIAAGDTGTYRFSFDARRPAENGVVDPSTAAAFIKVLDPNNGYATVVNLTEDMTSISDAEWASFSIDITIDGEARAGQIIQFGFNNRATNYNPSAVLYDNVMVAEIEPPTEATFVFSDDFEAFDVTLAEITGW